MIQILGKEAYFLDATPNVNNIFYAYLFQGQLTMNPVTYLEVPILAAPKISPPCQDILIILCKQDTHTQA